MSKPALTTSETEVVVAGQPSDTLLAALKQVGGEITDEQISLAYTQAESRRTAWQSAAIETGLLLLAKKQTVKHGDWGKWLTKFVSRDKFQGTSQIQLSKYAFIAQHFIADLEQGVWSPPEAVALEEIANLPALPHSRRMAVTEAVTAWVRGRSLRQMLADLRRADQAAEREEIENLPRGGNPPPPKTAAQHRAEGEAALTAPESVAGDQQQLELWTDFTQPLHQLDHLLKDDDVASRSKKDLWKAIVAKLQDQLRLAKDRLEQIAD